MKLYKTSEAAAFLGVSTGTIKRWVRESKMKAIKTPGGRNLFAEHDIKKILEGGSNDDTVQKIQSL